MDYPNDFRRQMLIDARVEKHSMYRRWHLLPSPQESRRRPPSGAEAASPPGPAGVNDLEARGGRRFGQCSDAKRLGRGHMEDRGTFPP